MLICLLSVIYNEVRLGSVLKISFSVVGKKGPIFGKFLLIGILYLFFWGGNRTHQMLKTERVRRKCPSHPKKLMFKRAKALLNYLEKEKLVDEWGETTCQTLPPCPPAPPPRPPRPPRPPCCCCCCCFSSHCWWRR